MKVAVFGGSFDPVHTEHIELVKSAIKSLDLDKLIIMPAHTPPHKQGKTLTDDMHRLQMCKLAFLDVEKAEVSDYEIAKGGTSYTYLTCRHFKELYPLAKLYWLVGTDMLRDFPTWKNTEDILNNVTLAVCDRAENGEWIEKEQTEFFRKFHKKFEVVEYKGKDVSSTKIRALAGAGMRLTDFTSEKVADYIEKNKLYEIPFASFALSLEKPQRRAHSIRVATLAIERAKSLKIPEDKALTAALFHDCAKNLDKNSPYLEGFVIKEEWGEVPEPVLHQYAGAYIAEKFFNVKDEDILNAIRFHTSARVGMSELEKLIFLADMLEEERSYEGVEELRKLFWQGQGLDECLKEALRQTLLFIKEKNQKIYPLTEKAYQGLEV